MLPPKNTVYEVVDGQVIVPDTAQERQGFQPTIDLKANGGRRAEIKAGQEVTFIANVELPENMGKIVSAEWDFEGEGSFPVKADVDGLKSTLSLKATHTYTKPDTYFATLRVASQREGDTNTSFTLIRNLDRVRIVVE